MVFYINDNYMHYYVWFIYAYSGAAGGGFVKIAVEKKQTRSSRWEKRSRRMF